MIERNVGTEERKTAMTQWEQKLERLKSVCGYGMMIKGIFKHYLTPGSYGKMRQKSCRYVGE